MYNKVTIKKGEINMVMTKEKIIEAANKKTYWGTGSYVNTDGEWAVCNRPEKLKAYIESLGFEVVKVYSTYNSSAIVETKDGYKMFYNGYVTKIK